MGSRTGKGTSFSFRGSEINPRRERAYMDTKRVQLVLGRHVVEKVHGVEVGGIAFYEPSPWKTNYENTLIYGPSGSGKTFEGYALASQSFFYENRTWIIFDTKFSVTGETLVYFKIDGKEQSLKIGDFVDTFIPNNDMISDKKFIEHIDAWSLSICKDHKVRWKKIVAVSKHKSPQKLLRVKTKSGREITSTEGHSFITLENGRYKKLKGSELEIGDCIPICDSIEFGTMEELDVLEYFNQEEIIDFDVIQRAVNLVSIGMSIPVAYNHSGLTSIQEWTLYNYVNGKREYSPGTFKVVTRNNSRSSHFPKKIELTNDFGFFCGIFIAEGYAANKKGHNYVTITNKDDKLKERVRKWLDRMNISYHDDGKKTITISCLPLTKLFTRLFGNGKKTSSGTKHLPPFIFTANQEFLEGFVDGYISGDGSVRKTPRHGIMYTTKSKRLAIELNIILSKFGMNPRYSFSSNVWNGTLSTTDIIKFKQEIHLTNKKKQDRLDEYGHILGEDSKHLVDIPYILKGVKGYSKLPSTKAILDKIPRIKKSCSRTIVERSRDEIKERYPEKANRLTELLDGNVWWDRIVELEYLDPSTEYVYDIQVENDESFMLLNGCIVSNSYLGNWRPNIAFCNDLVDHGIMPAGIPGDQIDVIAPEYYINQCDPDLIRETHVTRTYRIPLSLCRLGIMFELTKLKKGAGYAATFEVQFNELLKRTNRNPTMQQLEDMINDVILDDNTPRNIEWTFKMMIGRIKQIADFTIDDQHQWSPVGESLFRAAREKKPRWIVFTLGHAQSPSDPVNLAMLTAVLEEIKVFSDKVRMNNLNINLGVMIDELHTYVRNKNSTSWLAIHDLIQAWGRSAKIWRIFMTQRQEQLPKMFQDSIDKLSLQGVYQNIVSCQAVPDPGYGQFLDRLHGRVDRMITDKPRYYPKVKFCPPMIEVESDWSDDKEWAMEMRAILSGQKRKSPADNRPWNDIASEMTTIGKLTDNMKNMHDPSVSSRYLNENIIMLPEVQEIWRDVRESIL